MRMTLRKCSTDSRTSESSSNILSEIYLCVTMFHLGGGVPSPRKSNQIAGFKFLGKGVYMCVGGGELCVCVCV